MKDRFRLEERGTSVRIETIAGVTTFLTMAYIIFVQAQVLSKDFAGQPTGLSADALVLATCVSAGLATLIMGLLANYPIAQAPGMGENFFFITVFMALAAAGASDPLGAALAVVLVSGVLFLALSLLRARSWILDAISPSLKNAIAVGIGLFIAFIGLQSAGIISAAPGTLVRLNPEIPPAVLLVFLVGFLTAAALHARRVRGSLLIGILAALVAALFTGQVRLEGIVGLPREATVFRFDFGAFFDPALAVKMLLFVLVFLYMDMFDTIGTLVGVAEQAGLIRDNRLPSADRALVSDAAGTVVGACLGTSTVTSFIESTAGVAQGGRTGLANVVTAGLFFLAIVFTPLVTAVAGCAAVTAPAIVLVGAMMMSNVRKIEWDDATEAIPAFVTIVAMPLTYTIHHGLAFGLMLYPLLKVLSGRRREVTPASAALGILVAVLFLISAAVG